MIKKELQIFFATPIGYLVIALFLVFNSLFLFVFKTDFNILNAGFADLNAFFYLTPWTFIFIISAITMRSFSDEIQTGTIEILKTKPITNWQIIFGKYVASLILICIALVPTLIYFFTVYKLGNPIGNIDFASTLGSYIGLLFLASAFITIGLFSSTFSNNQIVSFLIANCISFALYYVFELLGTSNITIRKLGMHQHFQNISKGIIDTRDLIYFLSITIFFFLMTKIRVEKI
ncbi:MAG: gliding motility-associated ABC transporter permease subunit GldF [Flavobacteriaceae bacterium]|nr:gliding motility-associated ABC transporter permease subunit GldF [Flavobacteriaceae bacterium]